MYFCTFYNIPQPYHIHRKNCLLGHPIKILHEDANLMAIPPSYMYIRKFFFFFFIIVSLNCERTRKWVVPIDYSTHSMHDIPSLSSFIYQRRQNTLLFIYIHSNTIQLLRLHLFFVLLSRWHCTLSFFFFCYFFYLFKQVAVYLCALFFYLQILSAFNPLYFVLFQTVDVFCVTEVFFAILFYFLLFYYYFLFIYYYFFYILLYFMTYFFLLLIFIFFIFYHIL